MSDLTLIAEDILNTMEALKEACHAAKEMGKIYQVEGESSHIIANIHEDTKLSTFDLFRDKMLELHERLSKLKIVLDNEEAYAVDELVDAITMAYTGHRADYRRTPRMRD